jgi:hypothetical protein
MSQIVTNRPLPDVDEACVLDATTAALKATKDLECLIQSLLDEQVQPGHVQILLYFDEAHQLSDTDIKGDDTGQNLYHLLTSALSSLSASNLFVITLSTNSCLAKFSPPFHKHPSARKAGFTDSLQAAFTELPFDILVDNKLFILPGEMTLAEVAEHSFMVKFGRPLFVFLF